jgi:hypothetical protein
MSTSAPAKPIWAGNYVYYIQPAPGHEVIKLDIRIANYSGQEEMCKMQAEQEFFSLRSALPAQVVLEMCLNGKTICKE